MQFLLSCVGQFQYLSKPLLLVLLCGINNFHDSCVISPTQGGVDRFGDSLQTVPESSDRVGLPFDVSSVSQSTTNSMFSSRGGEGIGLISSTERKRCRSLNDWDVDKVSWLKIRSW